MAPPRRRAAKEKGALTMDHTQILIKPLVSEKATLAKETANQVAFFVHTPGKQD